MQNCGTSFYQWATAPINLFHNLVSAGRKPLQRLFCLAGLLLLATPVVAAPVTYIFSGTGSGSLGQDSFSGAFFQITATADTSTLFSPDPGVWRLPDLTAALSITGLGTANFDIATINVDNQNLSRVGFSAPDQGLAILFVDNPAFATYDLSTSIGPLSGTPRFNAGATFGTDKGFFSLAEVSTASFQAIVVPEPTAVALFGFGATALLLGRWRRLS